MTIIYAASRYVVILFSFLFKLNFLPMQSILNHSQLILVPFLFSCLNFLPIQSILNHFQLILVPSLFSCLKFLPMQNILNHSQLILVPSLFSCVTVFWQPLLDTATLVIWEKQMWTFSSKLVTPSCKEYYFFLQIWLLLYENWQNSLWNVTFLLYMQVELLLFCILTPIPHKIIYKFSFSLNVSYRCLLQVMWNTKQNFVLV
jgi:hypothetical protein